MVSEQSGLEGHVSGVAAWASVENEPCRTHRVEAADGSEVTLVAEVTSEAGPISWALGPKEIRRSGQHVGQVEPLHVASHVLAADLGSGSGPRTRDDCSIRAAEAGHLRVSSRGSTTSS